MCVCIYDGDGGGRKVNGQKMVYVLGEKKKHEYRFDIYKIYAKFFLPPQKKHHILCTRRHTRWVSIWFCIVISVYLLIPNYH